jgi:hypothetical protein
MKLIQYKKLKTLALCLGRVLLNRILSCTFTAWNAGVVLRRFSSPRKKLLAARCECLHLIKINCLALWLDESVHACTRSELRGASCEDWKSAFKDVKICVLRLSTERRPRLKLPRDFNYLFLFIESLYWLLSSSCCRPTCLSSLLSLSGKQIKLRWIIVLAYTLQNKTKLTQKQRKYF